MKKAYRVCGRRGIGCVDTLWNNNFNTGELARKLEVELCWQLRNRDSVVVCICKVWLGKLGPRNAGLKRGMHLNKAERAMRGSGAGSEVGETRERTEGDGNRLTENKGV